MQPSAISPTPGHEYKVLPSAISPTPGHEYKVLPSAISLTSGHGYKVLPVSFSSCCFSLDSSFPMLPDLESRRDSLRMQLTAVKEKIRYYLTIPPDDLSIIRTRREKLRRAILSLKRRIEKAFELCTTNSDQSESCASNTTAWELTLTLKAHSQFPF